VIPKQYRIHLVLMVTVLVMFIFPIISEKPDSGKEQLARESAERFLALVDSGKYQECWEDASALLKSKIDKEAWVKNLADSRKRTGAIQGRTKSKAVYSTHAMDSPDGEYIVLTYESNFTNYQDLKETVTVTLDSDARWKIAGYFVQ